MTFLICKKDCAPYNARDHTRYRVVQTNPGETGAVAAEHHLNRAKALYKKEPGRRWGKLNEALRTLGLPAGVDGLEAFALQYTTIKYGKKDAMIWHLLRSIAEAVAADRHAADRQLADDDVADAPHTLVHASSPQGATHRRLAGATASGGHIAGGRGRLCGGPSAGRSRGAARPLSCDQGRESRESKILRLGVCWHRGTIIALARTLARRTPPPRRPARAKGGAQSRSHGAGGGARRLSHARERLSPG